MFIIFHFSLLKLPFLAFAFFLHQRQCEARQRDVGRGSGEDSEGKRARAEDRRRIAVRRGDRSLGGGAQSARFRRGGQGKRVYIPRTAGGQYRLQNCGAPRRIHGGRTYLPRIRETSERSFPRVQIRGYRGGGGDYRASDAALRENLREEV